jgi:hypothetical protein
LISITIAGEPYMFTKATSTTFLWMDVSHTRYTLVSPGEYIVLDRHFSLFPMSEAQMTACISNDFKGWKRSPQASPQQPEEDEV